MRDTSLQAYNYIKPTLSISQKELYEVLEQYPNGLTRAELSSATSMSILSRYYPINSVCGRVNEMLEKHVIKEDGTRKCSVTFNTAHILKVIS